MADMQITAVSSAALCCLFKSSIFTVNFTTYKDKKFSEKYYMIIRKDAIGIITLLFS